MIDRGDEGGECLVSKGCTEGILFRRAGNSKKVVGLRRSWMDWMDVEERQAEQRVYKGLRDLSLRMADGGWRTTEDVTHGRLQGT